MRKPKLLLAFIAFFLFASNCNASILGLEVDEEQTVTVDGSTIALKNDYIPLIIITTNVNEEPTCEPIEAPDGLIGPSITNAEKVKGAMVMTLGDETIYESGEYVKDESGLTIKVRGSSSAYKDKKSYKIKLQKKADLLDRGNKDLRDKEWVLLSNDGYLTNDMVGFIVSSKIQNVWTPSYEFVNVVINGDYKGIYLLTEQVKQASSRIDVDEDTGYIVEYDPHWWTEDVYLDSSLSSIIKYTFTQPDSDDVTQDQVDYIADAVEEMEASLKDGTYPDYIDVESFARWILAHDLLGTSSEFGSNMFLSKNDDTSSSKFKMETLWDFDSMGQTQDEFSAPHLNQEFYYDFLFNSENTELLDEYQTIWSKNSETIVDEIISDLSEIKSSSLAEAIDYYSEIDKIVSGEDYPTFQEQIEESISWFTSRKVWLDENISIEIEDDEPTVNVGDNAIPLKDLYNESIPLIIVNTVGAEEPTCDSIEAPDGLIGPSITNADKVKGGMVIILGNETIYDSGDYEKDESGLTIKVRGSSSANMEKKSYKIKLQKKADLLNRGDDKTFKDKEWVLLNNKDYLSKDMVGFLVSSKMQNVWTPSYEFANVVINGNYKGIYLLAEQVKQASSRIDVDEDNGYIVEYDPHWWTEDVYFDSSLSSIIKYTFTHPDSDDVTQDQVDYIADAVEEMESSLLDGTYPNYIDVESFARWILTHDLLGTSSEFGSNMFLSKNDDKESSKFMMETLWDFDSIEKTQDDWSAPHLNSEFYFSPLFNSDNTELFNEYQSLWAEKSESVVDEIVSDLSEIKESSLAEAIDLYSEIDKIVSSVDYPEFSKQIEESIDWFTNRKSWLDEMIGAEKEEPTVLVGDDVIPLKDLYNENIPLLIVNTVDSEEPTFDPVETPEGCFGTGITNATKVPASLQIILGEETIYDSGDYEKDKSGMTIKIRGNSSAYQPKKPYKIKLQKKADLLNRGNDDVYKDKEWVLITNEPKLSNHMVGFMTTGLMGCEWAPACELVNVVMNGIYRGIYTLAEPVKRNADCRIDVDEDTGYIIEYDPYWWNEDVYFDSSYVLNYTFKYPDSDDVTQEQIDYIQGAVNEMETSIADGTYPDYMDVESFARWVLTHDLLGTGDGAGSNMFMSKYDDTEDSKFQMETLWDFDTIEKMEDEWATVHDWEGFYYYNLFNNINSEFVKEYKAQWEEKKDEVVDQIIEELESILETELPEAIDSYSEIDKIVSKLDYPTFEEEIQEAIDWFKSRKAWLNENVPDIIESGISLPYLKPSDSIYDIQGRPATSTTRGVIISNGKKYIRK